MAATVRDHCPPTAASMPPTRSRSLPRRLKIERVVTQKQRGETEKAQTDVALVLLCFSADLFPDLPIAICQTPSWSSFFFTL